MSRVPHLTPLPGRDYKSAVEAELAFRAGKDFILHDLSSRWDGKPFNIESARDMGVIQLNIRFDERRRVTVDKVDPQTSDD